ALLEARLDSRSLRDAATDEQFEERRRRVRPVRGLSQRTDLTAAALRDDAAIPPHQQDEIRQQLEQRVVRHECGSYGFRAGKDSRAITLFGLAARLAKRRGAYY